jgi:molybdopterin/thiamine biosynthesis adenylyltransferase
VSELRIADRTRDRYRALAISSVWELPVVRQARALIVGAGALGNEVAKNLAMCGVQLIVVIDRDIVEAANVTRSVFFREEDHGRAKTDVLAARAAELNPDVTFAPLQGDLESVLGIGLLRRMDMVFSCLDSRVARRALNRMCYKAGKAWVDGAMEDLFGEVTVYDPEETACYECGLFTADLEVIAATTSCQGIAMQKLATGSVPTTSTMGSLVAAIQVQEGMKLLHGQRRRSLAGNKLIINGLINDFYKVSVPRREECPGHFRSGAITEVPEFTAGATTAREVIERFRLETGSEGSVDLGRDLILELACPACQTRTVMSDPVFEMSEVEALCPNCGELRVPERDHWLRSDSRFVDAPLNRLGYAALDIVSVASPDAVRVFELTGDLQNFPVLRDAQTAVV